MKLDDLRRREDRSAFPFTLPAGTDFVPPGSSAKAGPHVTGAKARYDQALKILDFIDTIQQRGGGGQEGASATKMFEGLKLRVAREYSDMVKKLPAVDQRLPGLSLDQLVGLHLELVDGLLPKYKNQNKEKFEDIAAKLPNSAAEAIESTYQSSRPSAIYTELLMRMFPGTSVISDHASGNQGAADYAENQGAADHAEIEGIFNRLHLQNRYLDEIALPKDSELSGADSRLREATVRAIKEDHRQNFKQPLFSLVGKYLKPPSSRPSLSTFSDIRESLMGRGNRNLPSQLQKYRGLKILTEYLNPPEFASIRNEAIGSMTLRELLDLDRNYFGKPTGKFDRYRILQDTKPEELAAALAFFAEILSPTLINESTNNQSTSDQSKTLSYESFAHPETWLGEEPEWIRMDVEEKRKRELGHVSYAEGIFGILEDFAGPAGIRDPIRSAVAGNGAGDNSRSPWLITDRKRRITNLDILTYLRSWNRLDTPPGRGGYPAAIIDDMNAWVTLFEFLRKQVKEQLITPFDASSRRSFGL